MVTPVLLLFGHTAAMGQVGPHCTGLLKRCRHCTSVLRESFVSGSCGEEIMAVF